MTTDMQGITSHISLGTNHFERALAFYDAVLATLGIGRITEHPGACAWGKGFPEFWLQVPIDGRPATAGNGTHVSFIAPSKEAVHAFHQAALEAGGKDDGAPGPRPQYGAPYYGCYVRDLDGHRIEATFWDFALAAQEHGAT